MDHSQHHQDFTGMEPPMNHGHEGHDMPMPGMPMCSMNMIFNWQIENVCVVFESWHIQTWVGMVISCAVIFAIAASFEYLSTWTSTLAGGKRQISNGTSGANEYDALLSPYLGVSSLDKRQRILQSVMYAILMGISFWLMLVFMTYNGYLMIATILGAGFGHYVFGQGRSAARSIACH
ncbi:Ctr copper transporter family-domain-containing protein [Chlamydoabsidia padenii]|nr:Ctr copper transporter family-domain-containing protein [Chlamydoabsidia padenii]